MQQGSTNAYIKSGSFASYFMGVISYMAGVVTLLGGGGVPKSQHTADTGTVALHSTPQEALNRETIFTVIHSSVRTGD